MSSGVWCVIEERVDVINLVYYETEEEERAIWVCEALQAVANFIRDKTGAVVFWPHYKVVDKKECHISDEDAYTSVTIAGYLFYDCSVLDHSNSDNEEEESPDQSWLPDVIQCLTQSTAYKQCVPLIIETVLLLSRPDVHHITSSSYDKEKQRTIVEWNEWTGKPYCVLLDRGYGDGCGDDHAHILGWYDDYETAQTYADVYQILGDWDDERGRGWTSKVYTVYMNGFVYHERGYLFDKIKRGDGASPRSTFRYDTKFCAGKTSVQSALDWLQELQETQFVEDVSKESHVDIVDQYVAPMALEYDNEYSNDMADEIKAQIPDYKKYQGLCEIINYLNNNHSESSSDDDDDDDDADTYEIVCEDDDEEQEMQPLPKRVCLCCSSST